MGLDMYLFARRKGAEAPEEQTYEAWEEWRELNQPELGYWRKTNHIHNWFVEHCADGVDECQRIPVTLEQLHGLRQTVEKVLENRDEAPHLLPTAPGFFFGSTEYGEWYYSDLMDTLKIIDVADRFFRDPANIMAFDLEYQASW